MVQGVIVGEKCGWVRVFCDQDCGTLVYLTQNTGVRDICRDLVLADCFTIWLQYGGGEGRRLGHNDAPLALQDECLLRLGYNDSSRRARLGIDPDLKYIIKFYVGPASSECVSRSGSVYVLKGLVLPQWRRRTVAVIGHKMFIHPGPGSTADTEVLDLSGAEIEVTKAPRCGRRVLRISASKQVFLGFESSWERELWWSWLTKASETEASTERLDLSGTGLEKVPEAIVKSWPGVQELILSRNHLRGDLHHLERLPALRKLVLAANDWTALPASITKLHSLTYLDLCDNKLSDLPDEITHLTR